MFVPLIGTHHEGDRFLCLAFDALLTTNIYKLFVFVDKGAV